MQIRLSSWMVLTSIALLGLGCADPEPFFDDDLDFEVLNFDSNDTLALPYVTGAQITISASGPNNTQMVLSSEDEAILRIDSQSQGRASVVAVAEGDTVISMRRDGAVVKSTTIRVRNATSAQIAVRRIGDLRPETTVASPSILVGGSEPFVVRYFNGTTPIYGNGVLQLASSANLSAEHDTQSFTEKLDFVRLSPATPGAHTVTIRVNDTDLTSIAVRGVDASAISSVQLRQPGEAKNGGSVRVLADARDSNSDVIHGVSFEWDLAGDPFGSLGNMAEYEYQQNAPLRQLNAHFDTHSGNIGIRGGNLTTGDTGDVGCTISTTRAPRWPALLVLGLGLALAVRRRTL